MKLPPRTKKFWIASFVKELKEVLKKGTVEHDTPNEDDVIIPVTVKLRVKLTADGLVEKLKTRIVLRGDHYAGEPHYSQHMVPHCGIQGSQKSSSHSLLNANSECIN
jgi:hypothetical protein